MNPLSSSSAFYTGFARTYEHYASLRKAYITAVNRFIVNEIGSVKTIIDLGAGDGIRATHLAKELKAQHLTLVDNSDGMINRIGKTGDMTVIKADISSYEYKSGEKYDLVLCLWNVLGHIPEHGRKVALKNLALLIGESGSLILDVNNRYNISQYGIMIVIKNVLKDIFSPRDSNGDFELSIDTGSEKIRTSVHLFNSFEMERLIQSADLKIDKKLVVDYGNGSLCKTIFGGQLVYELVKR
jgi:2-polyprenyl-3-methyl-5-hydroxy-6-metoxy-1,4-benzoquinol methylase